MKKLGPVLLSLGFIAILGVVGGCENGTLPPEQFALWLAGAVILTGAGAILTKIAGYDD